MSESEGFKVGDKVLMSFGQEKEPGRVIRIDRGKSEPVVIQLNTGEVFTFTEKGKFDKNYPNRNLSDIEKITHNKK